MVAVLYSWMKGIIVFMIFSTVILNLLGKSNYKKYIGLVTGLLLVLLVISPILKITGNAEYLDFSFDSYGSLIGAEDVSDELFSFEAGRNEDIFKEYKQVIYKQTAKLLKEKGLTIVSMDIEVDTDNLSIDFGSVKSMDITASYQTEEESEQMTPIMPIEIGQIVIGEPKKDTTKSKQKGLSPMEINIKNLLADFYNIETNNINITIQEDHDE